MSFDAAVPILTDRIRAGRDLRSKARAQAIVYAFYSPKNHRPISLWGESAFCHLMLAEGDKRILKYEPVRIREIPPPRRTRQIAYMAFVNGTFETWAFSHGTPMAPNVELEGITGPVKWRTMVELKGEELHIWNWIRLRGYMDRVRGLSTLTERCVIEEQLAQCGETTLRRLVASPGVDEGLMLGEVASQLATGRLCAQLNDGDLGLLTRLWRPRS